MSRARLPIPLRRALREPLDDAAIEAAIARRRRPRVRGLSRVAMSAIAGIAVAAVVMMLARVSSDGALCLSDGGRFVGAIQGPTRLVLADGSRVSLDEGARLEILQNEDVELDVLVGAGAVTFDIVPGGPRRWVIEAGLATVVVLGTRLTVERSITRVTISVERGAVLVRGERVPERAARLVEGETMVIEALSVTAADAPMAEASAAEASAAEAASPADLGETTEPSAAFEERATPGLVRPREVRERDSRWRTFVERGDYEAAWAELGADGVLSHATDGAGVDELLALADVARLSGHPEAAVAPLQRILFRHRSHPSAPIAAFTLGRVEADALHRPARAARAFEEALDLGLTAALRPDALARQAHAWRDAGDGARASVVAAQYLAELPDGRHAEDMRALLEASP